MLFAWRLRCAANHKNVLKIRAKKICPENHPGRLQNRAIMSRVVMSFLSMWNNLSSDRFRPFALWERVGGDMDLLRELVDIFSVEYPRMMRDIEFAVEQRDSKRLLKASHKLKGSLLQFAAPVACQAAANLETASEEMSAEKACALVMKLKSEVDSLMHALQAMTSHSPSQESETKR
jgi:HPt (histidine-containing phosphotransfer) domain-containing protein